MLVALGTAFVGGVAALDLAIAATAWLAVELLARTPGFAPALRVVIPVAAAVAVFGIVCVAADQRPPAADRARRVAAVAAAVARARRPGRLQRRQPRPRAQRQQRRSPARPRGVGIGGARRWRRRGRSGAPTRARPSGLPSGTRAAGLRPAGSGGRRSPAAAPAARRRSCRAPRSPTSRPTRARRSTCSRRRGSQTTAPIIIADRQGGRHDRRLQRQRSRPDGRPSSRSMVATGRAQVRADLERRIGAGGPAAPAAHRSRSPPGSRRTARSSRPSASAAARCTASAEGRPRSERRS